MRKGLDVYKSSLSRYAVVSASARFKSLFLFGAGRLSLPVSKVLVED